MKFREHFVSKSDSISKNTDTDVDADSDNERPRMFLVPCSCGTTFAVAENYDRQGTNRSRYLICPSCGKRHDPKNRLLQMGYQREGYWKVDKC